MLEPALLSGIEEFLGVYGRLLTEEHGGMKLYDRVKRLRRETFDRLWPNNEWVDRAISPEKFHLTPWYHEGKLEDWRSEEMGICRLPTTVMALMPVYPRTQALDPVQMMVMTARIQREVLAQVISVGFRLLACAVAQAENGLNLKIVAHAVAPKYLPLRATVRPMPSPTSVCSSR